MAYLQPRSPEPPLRPARALLHPLWIASLVALIVNDHVLKGSGLLPGVVTGKLSDFAGMIVAPALLAALVGVRTRDAWLRSHVAVGIVFAGIQLSSGFAALWSATMGLVGHPWVITSDPTDLLALPMLALSFAWLERPMHASAPLRSELERLAVAGLGTLGLWGSVATSDECTDCDWEGWNETWYEDVQGSVAINNANDHDIAVYVRTLRSDVELDCAMLGQDPAHMLDQSAFEDAIYWTLPPRTNVAIMPPLGEWDEQLDCGAAWVGGDGIPAQIFYWSTYAYPETWFAGQYTEGTGIPAAVAQVVFGETGAATWSGGEGFRFNPPTGEPEVDEACELVDDDRLEWDSNLPFGKVVVESREYGPDGCFELELGLDFPVTATRTSYLCAPMYAFPFQVGDHIDIREGQGDWHIEIVQLDPETMTEMLDAQGRYALFVDYLRGVDVFPEFDKLDLQAAPRVGCGWQPEEQCASVVRPLDMRLGTLEQIVRPGDPPAVLSEDDGTYAWSFTLVRGRERAVIDHACEQGKLDIDFVLVRGAV